MEGFSHPRLHYEYKAARIIYLMWVPNSMEQYWYAFSGFGMGRRVVLEDCLVERDS
jgi:hypothetical protein